MHNIEIFFPSTELIIQITSNLTRDPSLEKCPTRKYKKL
jgi:hypothetical protein